MGKKLVGGVPYRARAPRGDRSAVTHLRVFLRFLGRPRLAQGGQVPELRLEPLPMPGAPDVTHLVEEDTSKFRGGGRARLNVDPPRFGITIAGAGRLSWGLAVDDSVAREVRLKECLIQLLEERLKRRRLKMIKPAQPNDSDWLIVQRPLRGLRRKRMP